MIIYSTIAVLYAFIVLYIGHRIMWKLFKRKPKINSTTVVSDIELFNAEQNYIILADIF